MNKVSDKQLLCLCPECKSYFALGDTLSIQASIDIWFYPDDMKVYCPYCKAIYKIDLREKPKGESDDR